MIDAINSKWIIPKKKNIHRDEPHYIESPEVESSKLRMGLKSEVVSKVTIDRPKTQ